jgi:hypothetical protein
MKKSILLPLSLLLGTTGLSARENTFRITVLGYQWTTTHKTLTFSWPGHSDTSCNGSVNMSGYGAGGSVYASGTTSSNCSTTYTPPSNQNIEVQKPVVYILADSDTSRMVLTCTRNVRWSQCEALNPGPFTARMNNGHFEVEGTTGKGKDEWVKFDIVQQTAISRQVTATAPVQEAAPSIDAPDSKSPDGTDTNSGFPRRWKSMSSGTDRVVRFQGDYIYVELIESDARAKAGAFSLSELKKEGDKYSGKTNGRILRSDGGASCSVTWPVELTLVTPERIEGRTFAPAPTAKVDWSTCSASPSSDWQSFTWIPVK